MSQSTRISTMHCPDYAQPLDILYQDNDCIAINKPAGMLVHRSWLAKHETVFVMQTLRDQIGQHVYPVHRLDRPTSGVLLFALNPDSARELAQHFEARTTQKTYVAVVRGWFGNAHELIDGRITYPLRMIKDKIADKHSQYLQHNDLPQQDAITDWHVLATTEQPFQARSRYPTSRYSLISLTPHTGRKHQLRRHMKHVFHPIIGDTSYGDHHQNRAIRRHTGVHRMMLHARSLAFTNTQGQYIAVTAPIDDDWVKLIHHFGWNSAI